eukprot:4119563-Pleurochrysis_carterae.AAC.1
MQTGTGVASRAGYEDTNDMGKFGRTRTRSRGMQPDEQRQPDFTQLTNSDTPDAHDTQISTTRGTSSLEDTPPEPQEDTEMHGEPEGTGGLEKEREGGQEDAQL